MQKLYIAFEWFSLLQFFEKQYGLVLENFKGQIPVKRGKFCLLLLGDNKCLQLFGFYKCLKVDLIAKTTNIVKYCLNACL